MPKDTLNENDDEEDLQDELGMEAAGAEEEDENDD